MSEHRDHKQREIDFSNLPDGILQHILSSLPTKEAVKTSILSTKWKNLWTFLPNIDIDDDLLMAKNVDGRPPPNVTSFKNFVQRVLQLRDASNIEKFHLTCRVFNDAFHIHSWISEAIKHNVQELNLCLSAQKSMIPQSLFHSTSLVSLKISMDCAIELPSHVSFPCLKTLLLSFIMIPDDDFTEKLLSGCPVLEKLVLVRICLVYVENINIAISSSTLKSLSIHDQVCFGAFDDSTSGCKIKIDAANLTYFEYTGFLLNKVFLNNTPSLEKSFINIPTCGERIDEVACRANDLLNQLQNVVSLRLSNHTMKTLLFAASIHFVVFRNLTHLRLSMEAGMNHTFKLLMHFLSFCPVLQSIYFSEGFMRNMHLGEKNSVWSSIPTCILNSLERVVLKNFHGYTSEICFLKCVLKNACALKRIDIWWSETYLLDLKRKTKLKKELEKVERKAATCFIKFS